VAYLQRTGKRSEQNGIEKQDFSRIETGGIGCKIVEHTTKDEREEEVSKESRVEQAHISLETLETTD
jgi:hypothetical protein